MSSIETIQKNHRAGFVALIGRPNVGKSTLLNQLVGKKVAITSSVAQTTRNRLRAILTTSNAQLIFVDTPGIHKPHHLLGERLVQSARRSIGEVDLVMLIFEACYAPGKGDQFIVDLLKKHKIPVIVVLNKWDLVPPNLFDQRFEEYKNFLGDMNWDLFFCSAINGEGCSELTESLTNLLPVGPQLYPPNIFSDQPEQILLAELIREQVLLHTREEIPHSVAVSIDRVQNMTIRKKSESNKGATAVLATVLVERKSQKGILIGKGGSMLKIIGQGARVQMQVLIDGPVYLELFVKVVPNWRSKSTKLTELGYRGE